MATYAGKVTATLEGHPIKILAAYGKQTVLEGAEAEGVVIAEFPDSAAALKWYESASYRDAKEHRLKGANYRCILVDGVK